MSIAASTSLAPPHCSCDLLLNFNGRCDVHGSIHMRDRLALAEAARDRYREALERIAGPPDRPFLGFHGKLAAEALRREPAPPEQIAARAARDFEHYRRGVKL